MGLVAPAEMCLTSRGFLTMAHRLSLTRSGFFLENKPNLNYKMLCVMKSVEITQTLTGSRHTYFWKHLRTCVPRSEPAVSLGAA